MMRSLSKPLTCLRRFLRGSDGGMSVEAALVFPMLFLGMGLTYMYYDAFRIRTENVRAAYTVADLVSRQEQVIDQDFIDGLGDIFDYLTDDTDESWIRVNLVSWSSSSDKLVLNWSKTSGSHPENTQTDIENMADVIPVMANGDTVIVVETFMDYSSALAELPYYNSWLFEGISFENVTVTSPRFVPKLEFASN